jgi:hypothetical protein
MQPKLMRSLKLRLTVDGLHRWPLQKTVKPRREMRQLLLVVPPGDDERLQVVIPRDERNVRVRDLVADEILAARLLEMRVDDARDALGLLFEALDHVGRDGLWDMLASSNPCSFWNSYLSKEPLEERDLTEVGSLAADLEVEPRPERPFVLGRGQLELVFRVVRLLYIFKNCARLCDGTSVVVTES